MYSRFPILFPSSFPLFPRFLFYSFRYSFNFSLNSFANFIHPVVITDQSYEILMIENETLPKEGFADSFDLFLLSFFSFQMNYICLGF